MSSATSNTLSIARYQFTFRVTETLTLPEYAGSALRGAFGHSFRYFACVTKMKVCQDCPLLSQCPYSEVFSPHDVPRDSDQLFRMQQIPVPYLIEAPDWGSRVYEIGDELKFNMVLIGGAIQHLPLIAFAWRRAFLRGIAKGDGKAELVQIDHVTQELEPQSRLLTTIYREEEPVLLHHGTQILLPFFEHAMDVHLVLETPLRIQKKKKILGARDLDASIFLRNLIRRFSMLLQFHSQKNIQLDGTLLNQLADRVTDERRLHWVEWSRYSSKQQQKMDLGGVMGHWYLQNVPTELLQLLYLGQWLHVGKETVFGLGGYKIVEDAWQPNRPTLNNIQHTSLIN